MYNYVVRIATLGDGTIIINSIESINTFLTMNLEKFIAMFTVSACVNIGPHTHMVSYFELGHIGPHLRYNTSYFMPEKIVYKCFHASMTNIL